MRVREETTALGLKTLWCFLEEPPGAQWGAYDCGSGSPSGRGDFARSTAVVPLLGGG